METLTKTTSEILADVAESLPGRWTLMDCGAGRVTIVAPHDASRSLDLSGMSAEEAERELWRTVNMLSHT